MILKEVLDKTITFFKQKNIETPRLDAEIIVAHGLGLERIQLYLKYDQPLKESELETLRELVKRRTLGEPIAYILGEKGFYKSTFKVNSSVLIPRPETETLVELACEELELMSSQFSELQILDLGSGSGCIAISLAKEFENAKVFAIEKSAAAFSLLQENVQINQCENIKAINEDADNSDKVIKESADSFHLIISNPPYIDQNDKEVDESVRKFEPAIALFAQDQGLYFYHSWIQKYLPFVVSGGMFLFEIGYKQGEALVEFSHKLKIFKEIKVIKDLSGKDRFLKLVKE